MSLSSKLPHVGTTIFTVMSKLATDCNAINLSQGFPGFDLAVRMTKEIGVASIPVSVFYAAKNDPKILTFCFAKEDELLEQALDLSSFHLNSFQKKQFLHGLLTKNPTANEYL